jgi:hypothetical protein
MTTESDVNKKIVTQLYEKSAELFSSGDPGQIFTMLTPTQPLTYTDYVYEVSNATSILTKPQTVAEREFRLSDQLINPQPITGGPNGKNLSTTYKAILGNYIPKIENLASYMSSRKELSAFLNKIVTIDGKETSRLDLFNESYTTYTKLKREWVDEKNQRLKKAVDIQDDDERAKQLNSFASWLSSAAAVENATLDTAYSAAVAKGYLHEVMAILGYLNSSSPAETLEEARQSLRHSSRSALDESSSVYPVQFEPSDWFKAVKPNLNPEDLTMSADMIAMQLTNRRNTLTSAQERLARLEQLNVSQAELDRMKADAAQALTEFDAAELKLVKQYGASTIETVKNVMGALKGRKDHVYDLALNATDDITAGDGVFNRTSVGSALSALGMGGNDTWTGVISDAIAASAKVYAAQRENMRAIEKVSETERMLAAAKSSDYQLQIPEAAFRVRAIEKEVRDLETLASGIIRITPAEVKLFKQCFTTEKSVDELKTKITDLIGAINAKSPDPVSQTIVDLVASTTVKKEELITVGQRLLGDFENLFPNSPIKGGLSNNTLPSDAASNFTEFVFEFSASEAGSNSTDESSASSSRFSVSSFFGSWSKNQSTASSNSQESTFADDTKIQIGMRVMKVNFNRSWFRPDVLEMTSAFHNLTKHVRAGVGMDSKKMKTAVGEYVAAQEGGSSLNFTDYLEKAAGAEVAHQYLLTSYPVAMLIAKDIVVKITNTTATSSSEQSYASEKDSQGGGIFCFSASTSSSSSEQSSSSFSAESSKSSVIRIPGPHIYGYINQFVPLDESKFEDDISRGESEKLFTDVIAKYDAMYDTDTVQQQASAQDNEPVK